MNICEKQTISAVTLLFQHSPKTQCLLREEKCFLHMSHIMTRAFIKGKKALSLPAASSVKTALSEVPVIVKMYRKKGQTVLPSSSFK